MNNQLIEKVIKSNCDTCPDFTFTNPLLDQNVAKALSKSFVKILSVSSGNSNTNNNLRLSVLENIRRICQVEPENHLNVDENVTELLTDFYRKHVDDSNSQSAASTDKLLDAFLLKRIKEIEVEPRFESSINPEVIQALSNLNENERLLSKDLIHWNSHNRKSLTVLKYLWNNNCSIQENVIDDVSVKMKSEIEMILLNFSLNILKNQPTDVRSTMICDDSMSKLLSICPVSSECYQVCINVLNFLLIKTEFDSRMLSFIKIFVESIKDKCLNGLPALYPVQMSNLVVLLDIEINQMPEQIRILYIENVSKHRTKTLEASEDNLIMILSHFPQWFDVYLKLKI